MRTLTFIISVLFLLSGIFGHTQTTPEQKKQQEEMEKKAEEAYKKAMEMMQNNPQMKAMMEQMEAQEANRKAENEKKQAVAEKENAKKAAKHREEFYWRNKVASNTNGKFADWKHGSVDIAIYDGDGKQDAQRQFIDKKYIVVGKINSNGQVSLNFPNSIRTPHPIGKSLIPEMHSVYNADVTFSAPEVPYRWPGFTLSIIKDYISLGTLFIGNSERTTYNLAAPCCLNNGDEGYRLYWVYVKEACTAKLRKEFKQNTIFNGEAEKIVDQSIEYDLNFKPGWNLIKTEIIGNYEVGGRTFFKDKIHTVAPAMPTDARYYFRSKE